MISWKIRTIDKNHPVALLLSSLPAPNELSFTRIINPFFMIQSGVRQKKLLKTSFSGNCDENKATRRKAAMLVPAANIDETRNEYILTIASPGFKKENFRVMIEKDIITIAGAKEDLPVNFIHDLREYDFNHWERIFSLPDDADSLMTRARYRDGELIIRVPRGKADKSFCINPVYVY